MATRATSGPVGAPNSTGARSGLVSGSLAWPVAGGGAADGAANESGRPSAGAHRAGAHLRASPAPTAPAQLAVCAHLFKPAPGRGTRQPTKAQPRGSSRRSNGRCRCYWIHWIALDGSRSGPARSGRRGRGRSFRPGASESHLIRSTGRIYFAPKVH